MATKMEMADLRLAGESPGSQGERLQNAAVLNAPYDITVKKAYIDEPGDGEIRIAVKWVGICGSDLEAYRGTRAPEFISIPARLGHEVAGIIDKTGPNVAGLKVGDKVTCRYVWGAFAEYIVCRPFNVKVLPPDFPMEAVSLIEILPGILHTAELGKIDQTKSVLIMGQGVSGLIMTQVIGLYSPKKLVVTDLNPKKLELAGKYGATHTRLIPHKEASNWEHLKEEFPEGFDVVIPCLLEGDGMVDAVDLCAMGGRIVMYGCIGVCRKPLDFFKVHRKRLEIYSTEPRRDIDMRRFFQQSIQLVVDGLVNTSEIVTHRMPLTRIGEAFQLRNSESEKVIHVLVDCQG